MINFSTYYLSSNKRTKLLKLVRKIKKINSYCGARKIYKQN